MAKTACDFYYVCIWPLRERIILPIAVASRFLIYTPKGRSPEAKANAIASSERFRSLRCFMLVKPTFLLFNTHNEH
ncbi:hypothetical protein ABIA61_001392 [Paenibacillus sp. RC21]